MGFSFGFSLFFFLLPCFIVAVGVLVVGVALDVVGDMLLLLSIKSGWEGDDEGKGER